jgi:hypothetical protein
MRSTVIQSIAALCLLSGLTACNRDDEPGKEAEPSAERFSFFVTSLKAMQELSGSEDGFGGDLRFGETGAGAGLRGADKICTTVAERSMPGNGKTWRAFLSVTADEQGKQVDAIDRIGEGPWYDRVGRVVALTKAALVNIRPEGADEAIVEDLPNEDGIPNHEPEPGAGEVDNHDVLTGTNNEGKLYSDDRGNTCNDWTSTIGDLGKPRCGHSWTRMGGVMMEGPHVMNPGGGGGPGGVMTGAGGSFEVSFLDGGAPSFTSDGMNSGPDPHDGFSGEGWMSTLNEAGCGAGAFIVEAGPPGANGTQTVGDGGGYGAIYCFALTP